VTARCRLAERPLNCSPMFHFKLFGSPSLEGDDVGQVIQGEPEVTWQIADERNSSTLGHRSIGSPFGPK
jgi:hypothetical protein